MEITVEEAQRCVGEWVLACGARDRIIAGLQAENAALRAQLAPPEDDQQADEPAGQQPGDGAAPA